LPDPCQDFNLRQSSGSALDPIEVLAFVGSIAEDLHPQYTWPCCGILAGRSLRFFSRFRAFPRRPGLPRAPEPKTESAAAEAEAAAARFEDPDADQAAKDDRS